MNIIKIKKVVIVTGATSGYGLATARKFKEEGYIVIAASRNNEKVEKIVEENGFDAGYTIDVTDYEQWENMKKWVMKEYGRIDVLVNNAGGGISIVDTTEQTKKNIDDIIALNLNSVIYGSNIFGNIMKKTT